jgi:hypothetical protein
MVLFLLVGSVVVDRLPSQVMLASDAARVGRRLRSR